MPDHEMPANAPTRDPFRPFAILVSLLAAAFILVCVWAVLDSAPLVDEPDLNSNRRVFAYILMVPGALALILALPWALPRAWRPVTLTVSLTILGLAALFVVWANLFGP